MPKRRPQKKARTKYVFELERTYNGPELDDVDELDAKQIVAAAAIGLGVKSKRAAGFRDAYAKREDFQPHEIGVQVWQASVARKHVFTLIYVGFVDGGVLFHAGTNKPANLMLWQHGFDPQGKGVPAADAATLTKAYDAARAKLT